MSNVSGQDTSAERYEDLRRRLEDESRAAAAASSGVDAGERGTRNEAAGGLLERFRRAF